MQLISIQNINNSISLCIPEYSECVVKNIYWNTNGEKTFTKSGKECQKWTKQEPHKHDNTPEKKPHTGLGKHNMCRNPDNAPDGLWCYTTDPNTRWEYCYDKTTVLDRVTN